MAFSIELGAGEVLYCIMSGDGTRHYSCEPNTMQRSEGDLVCWGGQVLCVLRRYLGEPWSQVFWWSCLVMCPLLATIPLHWFPVLIKEQASICTTFTLMCGDVISHVTTACVGIISSMQSHTVACWEVTKSHLVDQGVRWCVGKLYSLGAMNPMRVCCIGWGRLGEALLKNN